jgi:hypothetical protein
MGRGIPISQSKAPLPKPIVSSSGKLHLDANSGLPWHRRCILRRWTLTIDGPYDARHFVMEGVSLASVLFLALLGVVEAKIGDGSNGGDRCHFRNTRDPTPAQAGRRPQE